MAITYIDSCWNMYFTLPLSVAAAPTAAVAIERDPATAAAKTNV